MMNRESFIQPLCRVFGQLQAEFRKPSAGSGLSVIRDDRIRFDLVQMFGAPAYLRVPFVLYSDTHFGWENSEAEFLAYLFGVIRADQTHFNGDIVDGEYLRQNERDSLSIPSHKLALSRVFAAGEQGQTFFEVGNHDIGLSALIGEQVNGLSLCDHFAYTDPVARRILIQHGHQYDAELDNAAEQGFWHWFGDGFIQGVQALDRANPGSVKKLLGLLPDYKLAHHLKQGFGMSWLRSEILSRIHVLENVPHIIDQNQGFNRIITGHTHTGGFYRTPQGKLYMNSGDSTSLPQFLACDRYGLWAHVTVRHTGFDIETEHGYRYSESWADLGLPLPESRVAESCKIVEKFKGKVDDFVHQAALLPCVS